MLTTTVPDLACPVRAHHHQLTHLRTITQHGTGDTAWWLACPGGNYRFFIVENVYRANPAVITSPLIKFRRPRWGWPER